jgi:hypothetical protein
MSEASRALMIRASGRARPPPRPLAEPHEGIDTPGGMRLPREA